MNQLPNYADYRLLGGCTYCGGFEKSRDHVPSRVFLEPPYPSNLPVVPACIECNTGFSMDEEYFACLIECVIAGSSTPDKMQRLSISRILTNKPSLRHRIDSARTNDNDQTIFVPEEVRIHNIILKLARGHAAFELSMLCPEDPVRLEFAPICCMSKEDWESFGAIHFTNFLPEIGSRTMQRMAIADINLTAETGTISNLPVFMNDWIEVQENYYRYMAIHEPETITIKIVIREYLACSVTWEA